MYRAFFGFREDPFNLTPDPKFLYLNASYREALAAMRHGVNARKGFVSLIGEAGTGKTTLLRCLLAELEPGTRSVLVLNPAVGFDELLAFILTDLGHPPRPGMQKLELLQMLNAELLETLAHGGNVVVLIDEAQDLAIPVLEELRLLSNLETAKEKILQFVLAGQPELDATLARPELRQLRQRIAVPARLRPLARDEVQAYVAARVSAAGGDGRGLFTPAAMRRLWWFSRGVPRLVNVACDAALVNAYAAGTRLVGWRIMTEAVRDFRRPTRATLLFAPLLLRARSVAWAAAAGVVVGLTISRLASGTPPGPSIPAAPYGGPEVQAAGPAAARGAGELVASVANGGRAGGAQPRRVEETPSAIDGPTVAADGVRTESDAVGGVASLAVVSGHGVSSETATIAEVRIERGDTLGHIARRYYGRNWPLALEAIKRANPALVDTDTLEVGQRIVLPAYSAERRAGFASGEQSTESRARSVEGQGQAAAPGPAASESRPKTGDSEARTAD